MQITVQGHRFDVDVLDADQMERYETALDSLQTGAEALDKGDGVKLSVQIRQECAVLATFLDGVLGEGAAAELFGSKANLQLYLSACEELVGAVAEQQKTYNDRVRAYLPDRLKKQ